MKALDLTGQRFGKLVAIEVVYTDNKRKWFCKCDCGGELKATAGELRGGNFKSCGCLAHTDLSAVKTSNLEGGKFGILTVIKSVSKTKWGWDVWLCECECGKQKEVEGRMLVQNKIRSCGCLRGVASKHGDCKNGTETHIYRLWHRIKERCSNPKKDHYHRYGGRGIKVCDEWLNSFDSFKSWAFANGYKRELQIDRINSDGNYEPDNCRFVTGTENTRNQEQVKLNVEKVRQIKYFLTTKFTCDEIATAYGVSTGTIRAIKRGDRWADVA